jgi:glycosyltransferase involved in cell wall biosynthesis
LKVSLIISFYNKINFLELVLAGLERQTHKDFDIIIADDGSEKNAVKQIENLSIKIPFPVTHLWQEDKGFRKNKILNRAIETSSADYLIFIDGDCIPHKEFIKEHVINSKENYCFTGRRVNLSERISNLLTTENVKAGFLEDTFMLLKDGIAGSSVDVEKGIYMKNETLRKIFNKKERGLLGSNFSVFRSDMYKINGFDERYEAPSIGEDTDIQYRLESAGIKIDSLNNIAIQYHLYHKLQDRPQKNLDLFEEVKKSKEFYTPFGINRKDF